MGNAIQRAERREYSALKRQVDITIGKLEELIWGQEQWKIWNRPSHACQALDFFGVTPYVTQMLYLHAKPRGLSMKYSLSFTPHWTRISVKQIAPTTAQLKRLLGCLESQVREWDSDDWS